MAPLLTSPPDNSAPERELTILGHLDELRTRLIICIGFLVFAVFVSFYFARPVLELLIRPADVKGRAAAESLAGSAAAQTPPGGVDLVVAPDGSVRVAEAARLRDLEELRSVRLVIPPDGDSPTTRTLMLPGSERRRADLIYTSPLDPFIMPFKVALIMAVLVSIPVWVWQIWLFIAPGLTDKEKQVVRPTLCAAVLLFPLGAAFAYVMVIMIIRVMQGWTVAGIETLYTIRDYLKLLTNMMIVFGVIFELPVVMALLARIGIVTPAFLRHYRRHIYVGLAVIAMVITPADPFSMILALVPLIALFEFSVVVTGLMAAMRRRAEEEEDAETGGAA